MKQSAARTPEGGSIRIAHGKCGARHPGIAKNNSLPAVGDLVDTGADVGAGFVSGPTLAQELVIVCFAMADVREHGQQKAEVMSDDEEKATERGNGQRGKGKGEPST